MAESRLEAGEKGPLVRCDVKLVLCPALWRLRQDLHKIGASLGYIARLREVAGKNQTVSRRASVGDARTWLSRAGG